MIAKKTDANLLHPSFRLKALATTAQRPVEKDLFPAKVGDDVDTFLCVEFGLENMEIKED